ncbi:hypothetical protein QR680_008982 [Steinernema hermaphroditum]|uniref:Uncharacterized protein n=1 Tax=Steinernema hermaphroditum TaxID=289476 RepID=A0AA39M8V7_9BILA|nr:hypothetical protein QR680_008982 [Steinernema hermaphroditum]
MLESFSGGDPGGAFRSKTLDRASMRVSTTVGRKSFDAAATHRVSNPYKGFPPPRLQQQEVLVPPVVEEQVDSLGFGIAVSGGRDNPHFVSGDPSVVVSDVIPSGPACGLVQVNDRIVSANGVNLENADYSTAVNIMKESQQLNMIVKRRVPLPMIEYEQRTLKFTLSKSRKKDDFGIVLGCKFYIKEITNRKLAEKDPGLREGDVVLRVNGQSLDGVSYEEATKWLQRSRERLSLVVQRDVRRNGSVNGRSRWPSQNTVYEHLGSVTGTPRHSPSPMLGDHAASGFANPPLYQQPPPTQMVSSLGGAEYGNSRRYSENGDPLQRTSSNGSDREYRISAANGRVVSPSGLSGNPYGAYAPQNPAALHPQPLQPLQQALPASPKRDVRVVRFRKMGSLGIRVIGGNQVGIFVSAVQEESPAALHGIRVGDRILSVNDRPMRGVTREQAVEFLLGVDDDVNICVEQARAEYEHVKLNQLGDSFYIKTHFQFSPKSGNRLELGFCSGDIFHVTDTLFGGTVGLWQATKVYTAVESGAKGGDHNGVIPNAKMAVTHSKTAAAKADYSTLGRSTLFRKKLAIRRTKSLTKNGLEDSIMNDLGGGELASPAYERVTLRSPPFQRPVVIYGALADVARQLLLSNFALRFGAPLDDRIVRLSAIDALVAANKHCILDVSPASVEKLQLAQYAPIVVLIDVDGKSRVRELRSRAGAPSLSTRKLLEETAYIKKHHSHLLTATLDATKEDGWFDALRHLIAHLQDRRVWMPEFRPQQPLDDIVLSSGGAFKGDPDADSLRGDYSSSSDYVSRQQLALENFGPDARSSTGVYGRQPPFDANGGDYFYGGAQQGTRFRFPDPRDAENLYMRYNPASPQKPVSPGCYDVKQILADQYDYYGNDSRVASYSAFPHPVPVPAPRQHLASLEPPGTNPHFSSRRFDDEPGGKLFTDHFANAQRISKWQEASEKPTTSLDPGSRVSDYQASPSPSAATNNDLSVTTDSASSGANGITVIEHVSDVVDRRGATVRCPESGVELIVPEGAISGAAHQEISIRVCKSNSMESSGGDEALMGPLIMCGPQGLRFETPVELRMPRKPGVDDSAIVLRSGQGTEWKGLEHVSVASARDDAFITFRIEQF